MTRDEERKIYLALAPVRGALRGWAFARHPQNYCDKARACLPDIPAFARPRAEGIIRSIEVAISHEPDQT